jgi:hypothetical protein
MINPNDVTRLLLDHRSDPGPGMASLPGSYEGQVVGQGGRKATRTVGDDTATKTCG